MSHHICSYLIEFQVDEVSLDFLIPINRKMGEFGENQISLDILFILNQFWWKDKTDFTRIFLIDDSMFKKRYSLLNFQTVHLL